MDESFRITIDTWYDKPKAFYPYTSSVQDRIFVVRDYQRSKEFKDLREQLSKWFKSEGINAEIDNKIVFEIERGDGKSIFFGFYDYTFFIGLSVRSENKPYVKGSYNKKEGEQNEKR